MADRTYYLHTVDGEPATFDGYQICSASFYGKPNKLATSLKQIRMEQRTSVANRARDGFQNTAILSYRRYSL